MVHFPQSFLLFRHSSKLESFSFIFIFLIPLIMSNSLVLCQAKNSTASIQSTPLQPRPTQETNRNPTHNNFLRERMLHFSPNFEDEMKGIQQLLDDDDISPVESEFGFDESFHLGTNRKLSHDDAQKPQRNAGVNKPTQSQEIPIPLGPEEKVPKNYPKSSMVSGKTSVDPTDQWNPNEIIPDRVLKPISSTDSPFPGSSSVRDEEKGSIMGNGKVNSTNNIPEPSSSFSGQSSPPYPFDRIKSINVEDILMNKTKDCKETQFGESTPARPGLSSSVSRRKDEDKVQRPNPPLWQNIPERLEFQTTSPSDHRLPPPPISPYSAPGLFKPLKKNSAVVGEPTPLEPGIVTVVGIFLVSLLTFAAWMSQGDFNYSGSSQAGIIDPVQASWDRSFQTDFYNPVAGAGTSRRRQNVHIPRPQRQRLNNIRRPPPPSPIVWF